MRVGVIGAGIVGVCVARELSKYDVEVHVFDPNPDVGWGVSKANTGIIHACYDDDPDRFPVRARTCVKGNRMWRSLVEELKIPHSWSGSMVVGDEDDLPKLRELLRRGVRNGVPELRIVKAKLLEPMVKAEYALYAPTAGQISPPQAVIAIAENASRNGVRFNLETRVLNLKVRSGEVAEVVTDKGEVKVDAVVNAAGLKADEVAKMVGLDLEISPRKGEYLIFDEDSGPKPSHVIFPVPTEKSKGVVVTTEVSGHLMIGPNARDVEDKDDVATSLEGLREVYEKASRIWPLPPVSKVIRSFAGLRPEPRGGDFIVGRTRVQGFYNAAGMRSPGLTAAPAVGREIAEMIAQDYGLREKEDWKPGRPEPRGGGKVVCRCNLVREGTIRDAIERMLSLGVRTPSVDSVKFRTSATAGTCQGSFCRVHIARMLAEAYKVPLWEVTLKGRGSEIGVGHVKLLVN